MKLRVARKVLDRSSRFADYRDLTFSRASMRVDNATYKSYFRVLINNLSRLKRRFPDFDPSAGAFEMRRVQRLHRLVVKNGG